MFFGLKRRKEKKRREKKNKYWIIESCSPRRTILKKTYVKLVSKRMSSFLIRFIIPYNQRDNKR